MRFERIGSYDVTALIGEGGMGQVYQATDTKLNRQVALKILPPHVGLFGQGFFDEGLAHRIEAGADMFLMRRRRVPVLD